ncbi:MAG TPA: BCAM0308 family protein [Acidobacteriota bacterium]|nr:BCAM0308 family protein [Acidobacteriota bacterium]
MAKKMQLRESLRTQKRGQLGGAFQKSGKYPLNTRCPKCGLFFQNGVWKRAAATATKDQQWKLCPACIQIRDKQIGGIVQFSGSFAHTHRQEIVNRIHNVEKQTREERPLERIMSLEEREGEITVFATTEHLVARLGKSIQRDFGGTLSLRYAPEDKFAFVHWRRDA